MTQSRIVRITSGWVCLGAGILILWSTVFRMGHDRAWDRAWFRWQKDPSVETEAQFRKEDRRRAIQSGAIGLVGILLVGGRVALVLRGRRG